MQATSAIGDALNFHIWLALPFPMATGHLLGLQVCVIFAENMSWIPKYLKRHWSPICRQLNLLTALYIPYGCLIVSFLIGYSCLWKARDESIQMVTIGIVLFCTKKKIKKLPFYTGRVGLLYQKVNYLLGFWKTGI